MPVGHAVIATRLTGPPAGASAGASAAWSRRRGRDRSRRRGADRDRRRGGCGDDAAHQLDDLLGRAGVAQAVGEVGLDQRTGELGEELEVGGVTAGGCGDQEHQVGRAVLRAELHAGGEPGEGQGRLVDRGRAAVGDRDPAGQAGRGRRLAGHRVGDQLVGVAGATGVGHDAGEGPDHGFLVGAEVGIEPDQLGGDEFGHGGQASPGVMASSRQASTCSGRMWVGSGIVVPGSPAAALP